MSYSTMPIRSVGLRPDDADGVPLLSTLHNAISGFPFYRWLNILVI
ncbi:MAG: hypothetical protein U0936_03315 [Planctomycetaceae bacterium]